MIINKYNNLSEIQTNYKTTNNKVIACSKPDTVSFKSEFNSSEVFGLLELRLNDEDVIKLGSFFNDSMGKRGIIGKMFGYVTAFGMKLLKQQGSETEISKLLKQHGTAVGRDLVKSLEQVHDHCVIFPEALNWTADIIKEGTTYEEVSSNMSRLGHYGEDAMRKGKSLADYNLSLVIFENTNHSLLVTPDVIQQVRLKLTAAEKI